MTKRELIKELLQGDIDGEVKVVRTTVEETQEYRSIIEEQTAIIGVEEWGSQTNLRVEVKGC